MIYRYTASTHQELVRAFIREINRHPLRPPILSDRLPFWCRIWIMARWLQLQIADASGIRCQSPFYAACRLAEGAALRRWKPAARRSLLDKSQLQLDVVHPAG